MKALHSALNPLPISVVHVDYSSGMFGQCTGPQAAESLYGGLPCIVVMHNAWHSHIAVQVPVNGLEENNWFIVLTKQLAVAGTYGCAGHRAFDLCTPPPPRLWNTLSDGRQLPVLLL